MVRLALKEWVSAEMESYHLKTEAWKGLDIFIQSSIIIKVYYRGYTYITFIILIFIYSTLWFIIVTLKKH